MKENTLTPDQYCQERAAKSGSSFYYSFLFLPPLKRRAITALYAFCREVDDVADECHDIAIARTKLAWWRNEVSNFFADRPEHPVGQALAPLVREFGLPAAEFDEIITGMEMDLTQNRYADFDQLQLYCHRVAGVVGLLSARIFGYQDARTEAYAHDLGLAFQLTNIIRDVGEDARRNRIYLPLDELTRFGVSEADILHGRETENFIKLMTFQGERANHYYAQAFSELPMADRKSQRTGLIMAAIYHAVLDEVRQDGYHVLNQRISLTPLRKLWIAYRTWLKE
ncbi:squalene synthase [Sulfuricella denitrificans skB26]|uniref:Squalene synthase n=1 Tax=Sulfuricella denitrificans (strain DSM 22764 / NBRC 105220 / skB26) TaxID=1163617 RepID=S6ALL9_SULDS|nr:squalene synthase [Sulfuricella denitrificans skB26]